MQEGNSIEVRNITKSFKVYFDKGTTLKERVLFKSRNRYEERQVLKGISFEVKSGEALGLIGHNGCGKSTTLKLLTKIMYPESGTIEMKGRVSSLIELGAGFHPDMSGRQNIYINASIFGLSRKEIDERLDTIIDFSELREFIDNPVRTYSSGMYMRLAFAVAINVDADILLIDEILAVGDANFQVKCFDKLRELKSKGVTIVIVTHDTGVVERFCNNAVWINDGLICAYGSTSKVVDAYLNYMNGLKLKSGAEAESGSEKVERIQPKPVINENIDYSANRFGLGKIKIEEGILRNYKGEKVSALESGKDCTIEIYYKVEEPLDEYVFGIGIYSMDGLTLTGSNTQLDRIHVPHTKMNGVVKCHIKSLPLLKGEYILNIAVVDRNGTPMDFYRDYMHFNVVSNDRSVGYISMERKWEIG